MGPARLFMSAGRHVKTHAARATTTSSSPGCMQTAVKLIKQRVKREVEGTSD